MALLNETSRFSAVLPAPFSMGEVLPHIRHHRSVAQRLIKQKCLRGRCEPARIFVALRKIARIGIGL
jgi:hypothetical protein